MPDFAHVWLYRDVPTCASEGSDCAAYPTWTLCDADTSCRWISTGLRSRTCDEALPEVSDTSHYGGCFAKEPCDATSCPVGLTCTAITPCTNMWCESCEPPTDVCLPDG